jgi:predicted membrane protein
MNVTMVFSWLALLVFTFSLYDLFTSVKTPELARAFVRAALALLWIISAKFQNHFILLGITLLNIILVFAGLYMIRSEVQIKNDEY